MAQVGDYVQIIGNIITLLSTGTSGIQCSGRAINIVGGIIAGHISRGSSGIDIVSGGGYCRVANVLFKFLTTGVRIYGTFSSVVGCMFTEMSTRGILIDASDCSIYNNVITAGWTNPGVVQIAAITTSTVVRVVIVSNRGTVAITGSNTGGQNLQNFGY
jgi:hypothetical protein